MLSQDAAVIRKGARYTNSYGVQVEADCDGLLVYLDGRTMLVPDARMAGALNQLGTWRVKQRKDVTGEARET